MNTEIKKDIDDVLIELERYLENFKFYSNKSFTTRVSITLADRYFSNLSSILKLYELAKNDFSYVFPIYTLLREGLDDTRTFLKILTQSYKSVSKDDEQRKIEKLLNEDFNEYLRDIKSINNHEDADCAIKNLKSLFKGNEEILNKIEFGDEKRSNFKLDIAEDFKEFYSLVNTEYRTLSKHSHLNNLSILYHVNTKLDYNGEEDLKIIEPSLKKLLCITKMIIITLQNPTDLLWNSIQQAYEIK